MGKLVSDRFNLLFSFQGIQKSDGGGGAADTNQHSHLLLYPPRCSLIMHDLNPDLLYIRSRFLKQLNQFSGFQ